MDYEEMDTGGCSDGLSEDEENKPLTLDVDEEEEEKSPHMRRRASITDDQGQSAKLALVEARVELDELRKQLVEANADRTACRLEQKCDRDVAQRAAERYEETTSMLRKEVDGVRECLEAEVVDAEDKLLLHIEKARKREKALADELALAKGAIETSAASTLQRAFNKRWMLVLKERCYTATAHAEQAEAPIAA